MVSPSRPWHMLPRRIPRDELPIGTIFRRLDNPKTINHKNGERLTFEPPLPRTSDNYNYRISEEIARSCHITFLDTAAMDVIKAKAGVQCQTKKSYQFFIRHCRVEEVELNDGDYFAAVEKSPAVQEHLERFGGKLYIVTGRKMCNENALSVVETGGWSADAQIRADVGGGATVGPGAQFSSGTGTALSTVEVGSFVFAVRVTELSYKRKYLVAGERTLRDKEYTKGAELVGTKNESSGRPIRDFTVIATDPEYPADKIDSSSGEDWVLP